MQTFRLNSRQRQQLRAQARTAKDGRHVRRAIALLELDQGRPVAQIAATLGVTRQTLYNWMARFEAEGGPAALQDRGGRGRPTVWTEAVRRFLEWSLRHVIWSLVRKPGAFAAYRYREDLFPSLVFRRAHDALRERRGDRADVEYIRILHLAASTGEHAVEQALTALLERGEALDYVAVKAVAQPKEPTVPEIHIGVPDLRRYDALLAAGGDS